MKRQILRNEMILLRNLEKHKSQQEIQYFQIQRQIYNKDKQFSSRDLFSCCAQEQKLYNSYFHIIQLSQASQRMSEEDISHEYGSSTTEQSIHFIVSSSQNLVRLVEFQQKFIGAIHSSVYNHKQVNDDVIVQFQVNYITDINQVWNIMIAELTQLLIKQKLPYDNFVKQCFQKLFHMSYLPLLRINRHQLTQVSLFGFDIYVTPLTAILEIINRIEGLRFVIEKCLKDDDGNANDKQFHYKQGDIWQQMKKGWNHFVYYSSLWKIRLNIYLLKEYLKVGVQSLTKKDKEIVFTGCDNIFGGLLPILKQRRQIWVLCDCAQLTNQLYCFHPSYNYSNFFSLMFPLKKEYEDVFRKIQRIADKCIKSYILTPLLFAVLRNYEAFFIFIDQADSLIWAKFLNALAYGLLINFKARILQYKEVLDLFKKVVMKLGVMSRLRVHTYLRGELEEEWKEARQLFISALKIGYNFGELQIWHPIGQEQIQKGLLEYCRDSILMHEQLPQQYNEYMPEQGYKIIVEQEIQQITNYRINFEHFISSFNQQLLENIQRNKLSSKKKAEALLRIKNLLQLSKSNINSYTLSTLFGFLSQISLDENDQFNSLYHGRLQKVTVYLLYKAKQIIVDQEQDLHYLQKALFRNQISFFFNNQKILQLLIQLYFYLGHPKQALQQLFRLVQSLDEKKYEIPKKLAAWVAANIVGISNSQGQKQQNLISVKTFDKEYKIPQSMVIFDLNMHNFVSYLIQRVVSMNSELALEIIVNICCLEKWRIIPILNFPANFAHQPEQQDENSPQHNTIIEEFNNQENPSNRNKISVFSHWLIKNGNKSHQDILKKLMKLSINNSSSQYNFSDIIKQYIEQVFNASIYEQIVHEINHKYHANIERQDKEMLTDIMDLLMLLSQLMNIKTDKHRHNIDPGFYKKMVRLYLWVFDGIQISIVDQITLKERNKKIIGKVIESIYTVYIPILKQVFMIENKKTSQAKQWIAYMKKRCSMSLVGQVEGRQKNLQSNNKGLELPSIKQESAFLIQNSIDYMKQTKTEKSEHQINFKEIVKPIQKFYEQLQKEQATIKKKVKTKHNTHNIFPTKTEVRELTIDQLSFKQLTKQFLIPSLTNDSVAQIIDYYCKSPDKYSQLIILLGLTPTNHYKITLYCISYLEHNNGDRAVFFDILGLIGFSKQIVNYDGSVLGRLLGIIKKPSEIQPMSYWLDENAKKQLSDGFLISTFIKQSQQKDRNFIYELLRIPSLHFLLVYNQSNWRNLIDWFCNNMNTNGKRVKGPVLSNNYNSLVSSSVPSTILQYLQYIRITKKPNNDYEDKIIKYGELISMYSQLFTLKHSYLINLQLQCKNREDQQLVQSPSQSQNGISSHISEFSQHDKNSSISEISRRTKNTLIVETFVTQQEINLYYINQLANVRMMMDYGKCRDVLKRLAFFHNEIKKIFMNSTDKLNSFKQIREIFNKSIIKPLVNINLISNQIAKGSIVLPDFIRTYCLCSDNAYHKYNIEIGQHLEDYFNEVEEPIDQAFIYQIQSRQKNSLVNFIAALCSDNNDNKKAVLFPEGISMRIENLDAQAKDKMKKKYEEIKLKLITKDIIDVQENQIEILSLKKDEGKEQQQQSSQDIQLTEEEKLLSYLGLLVWFSQDKPNYLLRNLLKRQKLAYEDLKTLSSENYHFIKSILTDDNETLEKRGLTFTFQGKQLLRGGKEIKVNGHNKHHYCNYVGIESLGRRRIMRARCFTKGYTALISH